MPEQLAAFMNAQRDLPIYIDSILTYLKIAADCLGNVIPNLYGRKGLRIARHSFRQMRRWFIETRPHWDPAFADILRRVTSWFDRLADEDLGLRVAITHGRATHEVLIIDGEGRAPIDAISPALVGDTRTFCGNEVKVLAECVKGLCEFLDASLLHFVDVVNWQVESPYPPDHWLAPEATTLFAYETFPEAWLFPSLG